MTLIEILAVSVLWFGSYFVLMLLFYMVSASLFKD
jgi:hypothetical protein